MECQSSDSKKLFKVFDASKCKRTRKKREGLDETNSGATDDSNSGCQANMCRIKSAKASLQNLSPSLTADMLQDGGPVKRDVSSVSMTRSPVEMHRSSRSPRRHRRPPRDGLSLALKAGMVSTPRSISPRPEPERAMESIPRDQDSFIYAFLEEAIKRDKKKQRHARRHERRESHEREPSVSRDHRHRRKRRDDVPSREHEKPTKDVSPTPAVDQTALLETFAKLCAQMNENGKKYDYASPPPPPRTQSHKSLQCEGLSRRDSYNIDRCPERGRCEERSREDVELSRIRSHDNFHGRQRSSEKINEERKEKCACCYNIDNRKYSSKLDTTKSRHHDERYNGYRERSPPKCCDQYRKDYRDYDRRADEDKRKAFEQKTSRSFEVHRDKYDDDRYRRTARSDKRYDDREKKYEDKEKYYDDKIYERDKYNKERRSKKNLDRFDRNSVASREDDFRDRYSERERDSGLSVADEASTISGRSNYLRVVKQEISEQREAMDKMMKLWKELMRCFKGMSQAPQPQDKAANECANNARDSAAAQLRLWRECMRRYETVARDVGDTDARLMEEINKQRSEMAEMASMWQECLQRYRDMSNDFNSLKQQLVTSESPTRMAAPPLACAEGEGTAPPAPYRLPPSYPPMCAMGPQPYPNAGSPLRSRASVPPAWWWGGAGAPQSPQSPHAPRSPRRRSSPDSRASRDRERRHRHKDKDEPRYKEKSSKPSAARSEHRHRKR